MNTNSQGFDLGKLAQDSAPEDSNTEFINSEVTTLASATPAYAIVQNQDLAWVEATQGLQRGLIRSLQDYKTTWTGRRMISTQRERMLAEVTEHYVNYLKEEARMASQAALQARDSLLRQELAKLRAKLFVELADITGSAVVEIERLAQGFTNKLSSPMIQQAYARFVISKILALLEQSEK
ncbi:MAG: hypothetical protein ABI947_00775 [Chloroflexota bacterium]